MNITELDVDLLPARTTLSSQTAIGGSGGSGGGNGLLNNVAQNVAVVSIGNVEQGVDSSNGGAGGSAVASAGGKH